MVLKIAFKGVGLVILLAALAGLAAGCTTTNGVKDTYTIDQDSRAIHEMEWNIDQAI